MDNKILIGVSKNCMPEVMRVLENSFIKEGISVVDTEREEYQITTEIEEDIKLQKIENPRLPHILNAVKMRYIMEELKRDLKSECKICCIDVSAYRLEDLGSGHIENT